MVLSEMYHNHKLGARRNSGNGNKTFCAFDVLIQRCSRSKQFAGHLETKRMSESDLIL